MTDRAPGIFSLKKTVTDRQKETDRQSTTCFVSERIYMEPAPRTLSQKKRVTESPWSFVTEECSDKQSPLPSTCSVSEEDSDRKSPPKFVTEQVSDIALEFGH